MRLRIPIGLFWMFILVVMATLACGISSTPPTPTSVPTATPGSANVVAVAPTAQPTFQGVAPVSLPDKRADQASDINSSVDAAKKRVPGGDSFVNGLFERPFNATTMDTYLPYIDIVDTQGYKDDTWGYATITLSGADANGHLPGKYGAELDLNRDGRGEWLIIVSNPASTNWSTQGVQAWKDANGDVGGTVAIVADKASTGDGYETLVFDQGKNSDNPDGAWARISPDDPKTVNLAFKLSMLGSPTSFAMGAWAGTDLNPATFDYNDHMTHILAGDPDPGLQLYPLKSLAEIDNTCRLAVGFASTGKEPGLCLTIIKHRESQQPGNPALPPPPPPIYQPPG